DESVKPTSDTYSITFEEGSGTFFVELSRTGYFAFEAYSTVRLQPWRAVTRDGEQSSIRMSLGYGMGLAQPIQQELAR
ncbi:hypothetical protein NP569_27385, partial [Vibrio parahaemolyticus]|nr:hypothetical protein [Vibrio parahaemolyticus]